MRLATLLTLLFALPAAAQVPGDYAVFATQAELDDGGTLSGAVPTCVLVGSAEGVSGALFWDATAEVLAIYDASATPGERTTLPTDPTGTNNATFAALAIDGIAGTDVTTCRDVTPEIDANGVPTGVAFLVLSNADDEDFVARVDAVAASFTVLTNRNDATDPGDGISGVAQVDDTLYLSRQQVFGAPEDGIYAIDTTAEGQVPMAVVTDAGLDLTSISTANPLLSVLQGVLFVVSSEFGEGPFQNVVLYLDPEATTPELGVTAEPCAGTEPLFTNCEDGGLEEVSVGAFFAGDFFQPQILVSNNSFAGPEGETVGLLTLFDDPEVLDRQEIVFSEAGLVAATGVAGYTTSASTGYLSVTDPLLFQTPRLYLAGSDAFGGTPGIYSVVTPFVVGAEAAPASAFGLTVAPNPAAGVARVWVTPEAAGALRVSVVDALGRTVAVLFEGEAAGGSALELGVPALAPGVYTARVQGEAGVRAERFTVAR